ncbi:MAG TPA: hypothetical protein ENK19_12085, partial [Acidobacteria bacterium]|nr:hypothetical protein [Acidobacteriota bacterium]
TRDPGGANRIVALDPATGSEDTGRGFANETSKGGDGSSIGIITGLLGDYATGRIYATTRSGGSSATVWCVDVSGATAQLVWSAAVGDADAAPSLRSGVLYVGTLTGEVVALDADTGTVRWTYATGDGPVKAVVWPSFANADLYLATTNTLWALTDTGSSASLHWSVTAVPTPSSPLERLGSGRLLVGGGDGKLYELDAVTGTVQGSVAVASGQLGSPSYDSTSALALVGAEDGTVSAVSMSAGAAPVRGVHPLW